MLKISSSPLLSLIGLIYCISLVQCQRDLSALTDRWTELEYGEPKGPEKTFELIKELQQYYKNRQGKDDLIKRQRLTKLAWLDEKNDEKCTERSWNRFILILTLFEGKNVNIVPYIMHQKDELAKHCEGKVAGGKNWYKTDVTTWRELYNKLFSEESTPVGVNKTLDMMKQIHGMISGYLDKITVAKRKSLESLIDLSVLDPQKCTNQSWESLNDLLYEHDDEEANSLPYIQYWKSKRVDYCQQREKETRRRGSVDLLDLDDADEVYRRIFSPKAEQLDNETTLSGLKYLLALLEIRDADSTRPSYRQSHVRNLVDLSDPEKQDCALGSWNRFTSLMDRYDTTKVNILPYLLHSKGELAKLCRGKGKVNYFESDPNDWKTINNQIFTITGPELGPKRTLELLKELLKIYESRTDPATLSRKREIERLVSVSNVTTDKCTKEGWNDLYSMYEEYKYDSRNVLPYLESIRVELAKLCANKGNWFDANLGKWAEGDDQLYDFKEDASPLGNDKTLELMKYLLNQYQQYAPFHTSWKRRKLNSFIEMSRLSKEKCDQKSKDNLAEMLKYNEMSTVNLIPYLKYWGQEQEKFCKSA